MVTQQNLHTRDLGIQPTNQSLFYLHFDCGSCNGCELEIAALTSPLYDVERFGLELVVTPYHADAIALTGVCTPELVEPTQRTLEAMPAPKQIITIGDCAHDGGIFKGTDCVAKRPLAIKDAIAAHVPGCPPPPQVIITALLKLESK